MNNLIQTQARKLGQFEVNPLAFGCWRMVGMAASTAQKCYEAALNNGMNLIDTADVYGFDWGGDGFGDAEQLLGQVFKLAPTLREQMILATKGGIVPGIPYDSGALRTTCEASLKRLGVEHIDLYQIHRPDLLAHPQETAHILEDLRSSGKVREFGVSNFKPSQTAALAEHLPFKLASQQPEYSALHLDPLFNGIFDQCMQNQTAVLAWSPLAGGRLANSAELPAELSATLSRLAERESVDNTTIALAFVLTHPAQPVAIVGSTQPERIERATRALDISLDRTDIYDIIQASMGEALP